MLEKVIVTKKIDWKECELVNGKKVSVNFPIIKDLSYFDKAYGYYNYRVLYDSVTSKIAKNNKIIANESGKYDSIKIADAKIENEAFIGLKNRIANSEYLRINDDLKEKILSDKIAQLVAVTCGYTLTDIDVSDIHDILKSTMNHASLDKTNKNILVSDLQNIMDDFSLTEETEFYNPFKFRANKTMVNKIFRVYYDGNKNVNGHLVDAFEDAKNLKKWILEEMEKRLEAVTVKGANVTTEESEEEDTEE